MISYKTMYLICIILCLMRYTESGLTTEDQQLCKKNIQDDFGCTTRNMTKDILILPKKVFQNKVLSQIKTTYGVGYFMKILEKVAPGLTDSPRDFCDRAAIKRKFSSTLCMEQLHAVYHIANEEHALPVIKWTYVNKSESNIPKTFIFANKKGVDKQFRHFAYEYFKHMLSHIDVYVSLPRAVTFCQYLEPNLRRKDQNYLNITNENPEGSSSGEMTVKQLRRQYKLSRMTSNTLSSND